MTNEEIIFRESVALMNQGILKCAGKMPCVDPDTGEEKEVDMPECIHTFKGWKELGYQVKRGEHAKAKFSIWTPVKQTKKDDEEVEAKPKMYLKDAYWFTSDQVEHLSRG